MLISAFRSLRPLIVALVVLAGTLVVGNVNAPRTEADALPLLPQQSCSQESSLQSINGFTSTFVQFVNSTPESVDIYWLDYSGHRVLYNVLQPGTSYVQQTYLTHPWVATDVLGDCIGIFMPQATEASAVVSLPSLPQQSCGLEGALHSSLGAQTTILFVNQTAETVHLWWLDYSGQRQDRGTIAPGASLLELTFVSHPFVLADSTGTCIGIFVAQLSPSVATLTLPDVNQAVANAFASGNIYGPGASGISTSLTQQWAAIQADITAGNNPQAQLDIQTFVCHVRAQTGKSIMPTAAQTLVDDATLYFTAVGGALLILGC